MPVVIIVTQLKQQHEIGLTVTAKEDEGQL